MYIYIPRFLKIFCFVIHQFEAFVARFVKCQQILEWGDNSSFE